MHSKKSVERNNQNGQNTKDKFDDEKTAFERLETESKSIIFNVLYVLLKEEEGGEWKEFILILIDHIQIWSFTFNATMNYPWKSDTVLGYMNSVLNIFSIPYWVSKTDLTTYVALFYIGIFIVLLVILDIFYVSYSFKQKKFALLWPLQALRSICGLFVTVLFLPFLEIFSIVLECTNGSTTAAHRLLNSAATTTSSASASTSTSHNHIFPTLQCWTGVHLIYATSSLFINVMFICISLVVGLTYFDSRMTSHEMTAKVNSRADVFVVVEKITLVYMYAFLAEEQYQWVFIVVQNLLAFKAFWNYRLKWPFYKDAMTLYLSCLTGIHLWGNFILLVAKILENTAFDGVFEIYLLGLPVAVFLIIFSPNERVRLLLENANNFQSGEEMALQIRYYLQLVQTKEHNRQNAMILKGYIYNHVDTCPLTDCKLKFYKGTLTSKNSKLKNHAGKKGAVTFINLDQQQILLEHAQMMYRIGIQKFPTCTTLMIQYGFFLMECLHKKNEALAQLMIAQEHSPSFDEQFIIFRYTKMSEDFGDLGSEGGHGHGHGHHGGMDVVTKYAYDSSLAQCHDHIFRSAQLHLDFWNELNKEQTDMDKLNVCGSKINQSIVMVEQYWGQAQKLNPNQPQALKMYAKFLIEILNDKESGAELLLRAKDIHNMKQHNDGGHGGHEETNDIQSLGGSGTPCIFINASSDKPGMITNVNMGVAKLFGYPINEVRNHHVEKLMPEIYQKLHHKVVDDAITKGKENITHKERQIFGRNKNGYIFPVSIQIKMIHDSHGGVQFAALFKSDKQMITSDRAFMLINKDRHIVGMSSSCMKIMHLDMFKLRRYQQNGIDIEKLAPTLFLNDNQDNSMVAAAVTYLDWYLPESFDKNRRNMHRRKKQKNTKKGERDSSNTSIGSQVSLNQPYNLQSQNANLEKVVFDKEKCEKIRFAYQLTTIQMGEIGEVGWCLRLDKQDDKQTKDNNGKMKGGKMEKERVRQPLFQFRYDELSGKFIREIKENSHVDNAYKNLAFLNGSLSQQAEQKQEEEYTETLKETAKNVNIEDIQLEDATLFQQKRQWGKSIVTYKLVKGKFVPKEQDEEVKNLQKIEDDRKKKLEEEKEKIEAPQYKNNFKTKKALKKAINNKSTPLAILNLRRVMNLVILSLIVLSTIQFTVSSSQFSSILDNFYLVKRSYGLSAELQRVAYDLRSLILINEGILHNFGNFSSQQDYVEFMQENLDDALTSMYDLQNNISLSDLDMSDRHTYLMTNKSIPMYFQNSDGSLKNLSFSLNEALIQMQSAIFSVRHLSIGEYNEKQKDLYFITYNSFNDLFNAMRLSSQYFTEELVERAYQKNSLILILFLCSIGTLAMAVLVMFPVVNSVNTERVKVLSLFLDIPNNHVTSLANKCMKFMDSLHEEEQAQDVESDDEMLTKNNNSDDTANGRIKGRRGLRIPKSSGKSNSKFFMKFGFAVVAVQAYFLTFYILNRKIIQYSGTVCLEMNILAQAESYYSFALNAQRELFYNSSKLILNQPSFDVSRDTIPELYELSQMMENQNFINIGLHDDAYEDEYQFAYTGDLCGNSYLVLDYMPEECSEFISNSALHGMQIVIVRYFETLKKTLSVYATDPDDQIAIKNLFNSDELLELYAIQFIFIQDIMRSLVDALQTSIENNFSSMQSTRLAGYIIFIIIIVLAYLVLWIPLVSKLNKDIWRTKSMLTIIPMEVILKIERIQKFLSKQDFVGNMDK